MADTSSSLILTRCPACNQKVLVQRPSGEIVLLQRAVIVKGGKVFATCSECRTEVHVEGFSFSTTSVIIDNPDGGEKLLTKDEPSVTL